MKSKENRIKELWGKRTVLEIAADVGMSGSSVWRTAARLSLTGNQALREKKDRPTESEIKIRSAEVRAGWTKSEEARRRVGYREDYTVPCLTNRQIFPAFQGQGRLQSK